METLMEYLKSGTWDVDTSWSEEARSLQNMAVVEPRKLVGEKGKKLIHRYFRSLRMVDKEVRHFRLFGTHYKLKKLDVLRGLLPGSQNDFHWQLVAISTTSATKSKANYNKRKIDYFL